MYKETLRAFGGRQNNPLLFSVLLIFALVCIVILSNVLYNRFHSPYISYGVYVLYGIIGYYVYKMKIVEFRYSLIDDEVIFEHIVGERQKPIISVKAKDILYMEPVGQGSKYEGKIDKTYRCLFGWPSNGVYTLITKSEGKIVRILFKPSSTFVAMLERL